MMDAAPPSRRSIWVLIALMGMATASSQALHWWQGERAARIVRQHARPGDITLYTTSSCGYCAQARAWLATNQIPWRECQIEQDSRCQRTFTAQGAPGVPLMNVKGQWHLGFDADWLGQALQAEPKISASPASPP